MLRRDLQQLRRFGGSHFHSGKTTIPVKKEHGTLTGTLVSISGGSTIIFIRNNQHSTAAAAAATAAAAAAATAATEVFRPPPPSSLVCRGDGERGGAA